MKHNWKYEYSSYTETSAYCEECGMHRIQTYNDYKCFINNIKQKNAGDCSTTILRKRDYKLKELGIV